MGERPAALPRRLIEDETDFRVVPVSDNEVSVGWHGNAVLVPKSLKTAGAKRIELPGMEPRGAVRIDVEGGPVVVATHLGLIRRNRREQLATISAAVKDARSVVIVGDFNEWSPRRGLEPLAKRFAITSPGRSFHAARPVAALDRVAHTRDIEVRDAGVEETPLAKRASDHLPIWVDLSVGPDHLDSVAR